MYSKINDKEIKDSGIFIVDDEIVNLKLIETILKSDGYHKITAIQSASDVETHFRNSPPSLILLDINMPGMNGFDVIDHLNSVSSKLPPIVFLTAQDNHEFRIRAFEKGVLDYISKPFNRVELLSRVKNLVALENAYHKLEDKNQSLEEIVNRRTFDLRETQKEVVQKLGRAAEFRDNETGAHILRMSNFSALIANCMGYNKEFSEQLLLASPMHDIGKIGIPDNILLKPGKLTPEEWEIMKTHTILGAEILSGGNSSLMELANKIALSHHEKWDGSGYPFGHSEQEIPVSCRIVALADVFDALLSNRPYKKAWKVPDAVDFINEQSGKHFDPEVVTAFHRCFDEILDIRGKYVDTEEDIQAKVHFRSLLMTPSLQASVNV